MKKWIIALSTVLIALSTTVESSETKINGKMFVYWTDNMVDGSNEIVLGRTYLTARSKIGEFTSLRITSDLRETLDASGKTRYDLIIKYGYIDWKPAFGNGNLMVRFGLQPTQYIAFQNKLWGRRYISKTAGDLNKFLTTSDLGISAFLSLSEDGELGAIVLSIYNGTAYSDLGEMNKQKDINLFVKIIPLYNNKDFAKSAFSAQLYSGTQNKEITGNIKTKDFKRDLVSFSGFLAYRSIFDFGAEFNFLKFGQGSNGNDKKTNLISLFGTFYFKDLTTEKSLLNNVNIFARIDLNRIKRTIINISSADDHIITGVEIVPSKGFKASLNVRYTEYKKSSRSSEKDLYFNTLFNF